MVGFVCLKQKRVISEISEKLISKNIWPLSAKWIGGVKETLGRKITFFRR